MKQKLLIDTDVLIDVSRGIPIAINRLKSEANNSILAISTITQMELLVGCRNKTELQNLEKFLRHYEIIKVIDPSLVSIVMDLSFVSHHPCCH